MESSRICFRTALLIATQLPAFSHLSCNTDGLTENGELARRLEICVKIVKYNRDRRVPSLPPPSKECKIPSLKECSFKQCLILQRWTHLHCPLFMKLQGDIQRTL